MKAKVRLTYAVTVVVEGESVDDIEEWMYGTTPDEAYIQSQSRKHPIDQDYSEEYLGETEEEADIVLGR